ncbi:hypothetical protein SAMN04487950_2448 [Halogranum rubrum]|uniref:Uncharacterized protein n=1 Tax=Halogranum rubrum TaxID=553466 RepID=A0A1I4EZP5_9EURY|nr:hypothetical protein [Halogranum rubrum]SFL10047.1 hypothetical protein SAMN04487950_2448 [Halogranum rubrum]
MAAIKRRFSRLRGGSDDDESEPLDGATDTELSQFEEVTAEEFESGEAFDESEPDDSPGRPYVWLGLAVGSLAGLGASVYKLYQHRKAAKAAEEAARDEPWRVEEKASRIPDDAGTASLVGLVFLAVLNTLGERFERDHWE